LDRSSSTVFYSEKTRTRTLKKVPRRKRCWNPRRGKPVSLGVLDSGAGIGCGVIVGMNNERIITKQQQHHDTSRGTQ
ncbi:MAG: hypothetical protein WAU74_16715, partial [Pseudolabrys sp.]